MSSFLESDFFRQSYTSILLFSQAKEILRTRTNLNQLYVHHTGQTLEEIEKVMDRDTFMGVKQAVDFGVIDEILAKRPLPGEEDAPKSL